jgi:hypothetical protein
METIIFQLFTYDLWADGEGGYTVNDVFPQGKITLRVRKGDEPSTYQLNRAVGGRGLTWDGEADYTLYASDRRGNPACELRRVQ